LRVIQDAKLIQAARKEAEAVIDADPTFEKHLALAESLNRQDAERQANLAKS